MSGKGALVALAVVAVVAGSFVLPGLFKGKSESTGTAHAMGLEHGTGLPAGTTVPAFSEKDLMTGKTVSSKSIYNKKTLLFFSEGVMCQACFEQIQGLEQFAGPLTKRGIQLVSITPDSPSDLTQAVSQYGIHSPLISDKNRNMSESFNTLGRGMHGDTPGHAFALVYHGKVVWYRDYWLSPYRTMYVEPEKLLADIPVS